MSTDSVKVRFAPSPTGYLHIGGARTAIFNWVFARRNNGIFVLRIEDTDIERSKPEYVDEILDSMKWLGLAWDEGPYYQSERFEIYKEWAGRLCEKGLAYKAVAPEGTPETEVEELKRQGRREALYFRVPKEGVVEFEDALRGKITFPCSQIKDQVIMKANGMPTYNFACVVDDITMGITHILRGDDHISNTPKQIVLYDAFGVARPIFGHFPLIVDKTRARLSKRSGATAISEFRQMGYLPEAICNYLLLLSWSPGENKEIVSLEEAIERFDLKQVNKTAAMFDYDKLNWVNNSYIKAKAPDEILAGLKGLGLLKEKDIDEAYAKKVISLMKERATTLQDFVSWADYFWRDDYEVEEEAAEKYLTPQAFAHFKNLIGVFKDLASFDESSIETAFRRYVAEAGIKAKELIHPVRVAVSGKKVGPGLFELLAVLGREKVIERLARYL